MKSFASRALAALASCVACANLDAVPADGDGGDALDGAGAGADTGRALPDVVAKDTGLTDSATPDAGPASTDLAAPKDTKDVPVGPQPVGLWTQIKLPGNPNTSFHGVWADGPTRVLAAGTGGTVTGHDGLQWKVYETGHFPSLNAVSASPGGGYAVAVGMAGTVVHAFGKDGVLGQLWTPPGACQKPADCNDSDACTTDVCESGLCLYAPSGQAGCCGGAAFSDSFDKGLSAWVVKDTAAAIGQGGIVWNAAALTGKDGKPRHTSPPNAAYFGLPDTPCAAAPAAKCPSYDNGKPVGATLTSVEFLVPKAAQATLSFQLLLDVDPSLDQLTVAVLPATGVKQVLWQKTKALPTGTTAAKFQVQTVDLTKFAGQKLKLEFAFDSATSFNNAGEGVYLDDVLVTTVCAAGQATGKGLTNATFFGTWVAADDDAWAVGADGAVAHWDGKAWGLVSGGAPPQDLYGIGGTPDGPAFAVGKGGVVGKIDAAGLGPMPSGTTKALRAVAVRKVAGGAGQAGGAGEAAAWEAVAVGDGALVEWSGATWTPVVGAAATPQWKGVAALDDGTFVAVAGNQVWERAGGQPWQLKAAASGSLSAVAALPAGAGGAGGAGGVGGGAVAVGYPGLVAWRKNGVWNFQPQVAGFGSLYAVHALAADDVWAAADGGLMHHFTGTDWEEVKTSTTVNLRAVWAASKTAVFAAGLVGSIIQYDGTTWFNMKVPKNTDYLGIWGRSANEVYAVGVGGVVLRWDGATWTQIGAPVTGSLRAVWGVAKNDVWAVGDDGLVAHSTGGSFTVVPIEPYQPDPEQKPYEVKTTLHAVWGGKADDVWAAGAPDAKNKGVLIHWDGKTWTYTPIMENEARTFRSIAGWSHTKIVFTGTQGMAYLFDGTQFQELHPNTIATLFGVAVQGKHALVAGDIGTLLQFTPL